MGFMRRDDYILLMDSPKADRTRLTEDELKQLVDVGVKTGLYFYTDWNAVEPERGFYDWREHDEALARYNRAGLRTLFMCSTRPPQWFPDEWYCYKYFGVSRDALSLWNKDAQDYSDNFYRIMRERYTTPTSMVINSQITDGETIYLNEPAYYDPAALKDYERLYGKGARPVNPNSPEVMSWLEETYIRVLMKQAHILIETPHRELFTMLNPRIGEMGFYPGNGCHMLPTILAHYAEENCDITQIYYTWIQWAHLHPYMNQLQAQYNTKVYGGAEYCEGMPTTAPVAAKQGVRLICSPCHEYTPHLHLEQWQLDNIRQAIKVLSK